MNHVITVHCSRAYGQESGKGIVSACFQVMLDWLTVATSPVPQVLQLDHGGSELRWLIRTRYQRLQSRQ